MRSGQQPPPVMSGGGGAKISGTYEDDWNQFTLLDLVTGLAHRMLPEPPGMAGHGFEFWVDRVDRREWHQVKYQRGRAGKWTFDALGEDKEKVLIRFRDKLQGEPNSACCFVSAHSASPLDLLCARAAHAPTFQRFLDVFVGPEGDAVTLGKDFEQLWRDEWRVDAELAWEWLRARVFVRVQDWTTLQERLGERIRTFIDGDVDKIRRLLDEYLTSALHNEVERDGLVSFLTAKGCPPREWPTGTGGLSDRVAQTARDFVDAANRNLIAATFMSRDQTAEIRGLLARRNPPGTILIVGKEGCGKSAALAQVVQQQALAGQPTLVLDVQTLSQEPDTIAAGKTLNLPMPPSAALAAAAGDAPAALFLDAVDAVGPGRGAAFELYSVIDRIIRDVRAHPNLTLVMTCRQEDFATDDRLRALLREPTEVQTVEIPPLAVEQVRGAVSMAGGDASTLSEQQVEILQFPNMLKLFVRSIGAGPPDFSTRQELLDRFYAWVTRND